jgi:hypothetical protein
LKSLVVVNFVLDSDGTPEDVNHRLSNLNLTRSSGSGIKNLDFVDNTIYATLVKIVYTYIYDYNDITHEVEKKQISIINEIRFFLDFNTNLICTFGAATNVGQLRTFLKGIFDTSIKITPCNLTIPEICKKLTSKNIPFDYKSISINNFNYKNGVTGRFSGIALKNNVIQELINEYSTDVQKLGFNIYLPDYNDPVEILLGDMGQLKVDCNDEEFTDIFQQLSSLLYN